jgi:hypothetical protein
VPSRLLLNNNKKKNGKDLKHLRLSTQWKCMILLSVFKSKSILKFRDNQLKERPEPNEEEPINFIKSKHNNTLQSPFEMRLWFFTQENIP